MIVMDEIFDAAIKHDLHDASFEPRNLKFSTKSFLFGKHGLHRDFCPSRMAGEKDKLTWKLEEKIELNNQILFFK